MRVSVFGLGYVGSVTAACLACEGHQVIGVDTMETKVDMINEGSSPVIEKDLDELTKKAVGDGFLRATTNAHEAIEGTELSLICVGTPSQLNGNLDTRFVRRVCEQIGKLSDTRHPSTWWSFAVRCCRARCTRSLFRFCKRSRERGPRWNSVFASTPNSCEREAQFTTTIILPKSLLVRQISTLATFSLTFIRT